MFTVKIFSINTVAGYGKTADLNSKKDLLKNRTGGEVDQFVPSNNEKVITYSKQPVKAEKTGRTSIAGLREESERAYESLRRIVIELLERQGYCVQHVKGEGLDELEIDEAARTEAAGLIADDGPLGAEAVSNRIVDFAIAISGGDKTRLPEIREAIEEGFRQVKNMLGGLPEISLRTYDLIMEKLDKWEKEDSMSA